MANPTDTTTPARATAHTRPGKGSRPLATYFASPERAGREEIERQHRYLRNEAAAKVLDCLPSAVVILNDHRQIVFANRTFLGFLGRTMADMLGLRVGEAVACVHAGELEGGCGTTEFCTQCGAVSSMLRGLDGRRSVKECRILRRTPKGPEALDIEVCSSPLPLEGGRYILFNVTDVSHRNRRRVLERIFFHDIQGSIGGLKSLIELVVRELPEDLREEGRVIAQAFSQLMDEINSQKSLLAAENNELEVRPEPIDTRQLLDYLSKSFEPHFADSGARLVVHHDPAGASLNSDLALLRRVLGNMIKNGAEASSAGDEVILRCMSDGEFVEFSVTNPSFMPREVQLQVFQRSFSTKGVGRGLGTYSIKLLGERYLQGEASFSSDKDQGTTFRIRLPKTLKGHTNPGECSST